jgi:hypothetical protein
MALNKADQKSPAHGYGFFAGDAHREETKPLENSGILHARHATAPMIVGYST